MKHAAYNPTRPIIQVTKGSWIWRLDNLEAEWSFGTSGIHQYVCRGAGFSTQIAGCLNANPLPNSTFTQEDWPLPHYTRTSPPGQAQWWRVYSHIGVNGKFYSGSTLLTDGIYSIAPMPPTGYERFFPSELPVYPIKQTAPTALDVIYDNWVYLPMILAAPQPICVFGGKYCVYDGEDVTNLMGLLDSSDIDWKATTGGLVSTGEIAELKIVIQDEDFPDKTGLYMPLLPPVAVSAAPIIDTVVGITTQPALVRIVTPPVPIYPYPLFPNIVRIYTGTRLEKGGSVEQSIWGSIPTGVGWVEHEQAGTNLAMEREAAEKLYEILRKQEMGKPFPVRVEINSKVVEGLAVTAIAGGAVILLIFFAPEVAIPAGIAAGIVYIYSLASPGTPVIRYDEEPDLTS